MNKAIIFDCFGVLVTDALEAMLQQMRESDPGKAAQIVDSVIAANKGFITREENRAAIAQLLGISTDEYADRIKDGEVKNDELLDYILALRPHYKTAMLSNVSSSGLEVRFSVDDQAKYFDTVVASGVVGFAKPEARAYEIVAERLDMRLDECIMIDDREEYCEGARAVGMRAIVYASFPQLKRDLAALGVQPA